MQGLGDIRFGKVLVRGRTRQVWVDGHRVALGDRAFDVLALLIAQRDRVVDKAELLDAVWPGRGVGDGNLHVHVSALRRQFGADSIATVHGRGYRFMAAVDDLGAGASPARAARAAPAATEPAPPATTPRRAPAPLFGRDDEVRSGLDRLQRGGGLTLVGPGGAGKTRLARELAVRWPARAPEGAAGVAWLDLTTIHDPHLLPGAVTRALGMAVVDSDAADGGSDASAVARLAARAATLQGLLVLDNAEHLAQGCARIVAALREQAAGLRVLVTSRQALGLADEPLLDVAGLPVPADAAAPGAALAPAVALFTYRAARADPDFEVQPETLGDLLAICRKLDGLPLALELAAARVPFLGVRGVLASLEEPLQGLVDRSPRSTGRHLGVHAVLEWSERMLEPDERTLLQQLALMQGSFTLDEAAAVAGSLARWQFFACFEALVRKSLVAREPGGQGSGGEEPAWRWRLLETTRQFALARLREGGSEAAAAERHAEACAQQAERLQRQWLEGRLREVDVARQCGLALDNWCSALDWACRPGLEDDSPRRLLAARLLGGSARTLLMGGLRVRAMAWASALVHACAPAGRAEPSAPSVPPIAGLPAEVEARLRRALSQTAPPSLRWTSPGRASLERAVALFEQLGDRAGALDAALELAHEAARVRDEAQAIAALERARLALGTDAPPRLRAGLMEMRLRLHLLMAIGVAPGSREVDEVLADLDAAGDRLCRSALLMRIEQADDWLLQGRHHAARRALQAVCDDVQQGWRQGWRAMYAPFDTLALAQLLCGDPDGAATSLQQALDSARRADIWAEVGAVLAMYLAVRGRHRAAMEVHGATLAYTDAHGRPPDRLQSHALQGALEHSRRACRAADLARWCAAGADRGPSGLREMLADTEPRFGP